MNFIKHLIECNCILPQFRNLEQTVFHKFIVFSEIKNEKIVEKYVKCPNCELVHRVFDVGKSNIIGDDRLTKTIIDEDEIKLSIPEKLLKILSKYDLSLHVWEHIKFVLEKSLWGEEIIIFSFEKDGKKIGKKLKINGPDLFVLNSFEEQVFI